MIVPLVIILATLPCIVTSIPANPHGFTQLQPDGLETPNLFVHGDESFHYMTDEDGYVVTQDDNGWFTFSHYLQDDKGRTIGSNGLRVGKVSPTKRQYQSLRAKDIIAHKNRINGGGDGNKRRRSLEQQQEAHRHGHERKRHNNARSPSRNLGRITSPQTQDEFRHIVLLIRFSDHIHRHLPSREDISVLYNKVGGDSILAPTGSVREVYLENSYNNLQLVTSVYGWITVSKPEEYYADGEHGFGRLLEAIVEGLDKLDSDPNFSFWNFNNNGTGIKLGVLHSGYGAEHGWTDCHGQANTNRIWAHNGAMSWQSAVDGVTIGNYYASSALRGSCGSGIVRVGVIAHEMGHYLGLPDLYDPDFDGRGIGSYDMMSNSWGFDGTGLFPSPMSAWSKIKLGWVTPIPITSSGTYTIEPSALSPQVYRIDDGFPDNEYLLIENRQRVGYDSKLPGDGGLAVWHVDDAVQGQRNGGHPFQDGWPENGHHYQVSLLQADGQYDLERGQNYGDEGDLWHAENSMGLGPGGGGAGNDVTYPNSDSFQFGNIQETGIRIHDMSTTDRTMTFQVTLQPLCPPGYTGTIASRDCTGFCYCAGGVQVVEYIPCGVGNLFDEAIGDCSPSHSVVCGGSDQSAGVSPPSVPILSPTMNPTVQGDADKPPCATGFTGAYILEGCAGFYMCHNGVKQGSDIPCIPGTLFDKTLGHCASAELVECDPTPLPHVPQADINSAYEASTPTAQPSSIPDKIMKVPSTARVPSLAPASALALPDGAVYLDQAQEEMDMSSSQTIRTEENAERVVDESDASSPAERLMITGESIRHQQVFLVLLSFLVFFA